MGCLNIIEELNEYQDRQKRLEFYSDRIRAELFFELSHGKKVVYDTFIERIAYLYHLKNTESKKVIDGIIDKPDNHLSCDGTTISRAGELVSCSCGAKYSNLLRVCPACKNGG